MKHNLDSAHLGEGFVAPWTWVGVGSFVAAGIAPQASLHSVARRRQQKEDYLPRIRKEVINSGNPAKPTTLVCEGDHRRVLRVRSRAPEFSKIAPIQVERIRSDLLLPLDDGRFG